MDLYEKRQLQYKYTFITVMMICISIVVSSCITYYYFGGARKSALINAVEEGDNSEVRIGSTVEIKLRGFRKVIDSQYKGEIDEKSLLDGAVKGYIEGLGDKYSEYMTADEWEDFQLKALGDFEGIGIYVSPDKNGNIVILTTVEDSPAEKAGIKANDIIVEVDGENVLGIEDAGKVTSKIKGTAGTTVHLKLARGEEYVELDVERSVIKLYHVKSEILEKDIGYIQLLTFDTDCSVEVEEAIKDLESKGAKKLILDLRHNTGGLVTEACKIANFFIPNDEDLLIIEMADGTRQTTKTVTDSITDMELVLLVDEYSASASEILAGALKDHERATLVGVNTYGKGVIQNVFSLLDGSVLKLTVAEYYTPNETKIHEIGIKPDYEVELPQDVKDEKDFVDTQLNKAKELLQ